VRKELAKTYWLNVFNGFGFVVDYVNGAMRQYPNDTVMFVYKTDFCEEKTANL